MKKIIALMSLIGLAWFIFLINVSASSPEELTSANNLAKKEIIKNHSDNPDLYHLDSAVLRQEIGLISRRVSWVKENNSCKWLFDDLSSTKPNDWACKNIEALVENKLISANASFNPEKNISKSEALIMFVKSIWFIDFVIDPNSSKNWQEQVVDFAVENEIAERFTDYNTDAKRGWIFKVADYSIKVKENRVKEGLWRDKYSDEVKIPKEESWINTQIYVEAEDGKLTWAWDYSNLGKSSRGEEAYLGDGWATVSYTINSKNIGNYVLHIRLSDDGIHANWTRSATIVVNWKTIAYNHISKDTEWWNWFSLSNVILKQWENNISFRKNTTTSAAFIMDAFKLVPGEIALDEIEEKNDEQYNGLYDNNNNLIDRCEQYKLTTFKWVSNLETYTCDSITNVLNLDYHWHDFNPDSDWTLYLILTNNDKSGDLELYVKNYWTLIWKNGAQTFFKVPNVKKWETISYRISWTKWTNYYLRIDFNKWVSWSVNNWDDEEPKVGTPEFLKQYPRCTESFRSEIKKSREFNSQIDLTTASQEVHHSTVFYDPCSSEQQSCLDDVKKDYYGDGKYTPCYIWSSCYENLKTALIKCSNDSMNCKEQAFCGFVTK